MAMKRMPEKISEEANELFEAYIKQKRGAFSDDEMIEYVKQHCSKELLPYLENSGTELVK